MEEKKKYHPEILDLGRRGAVYAKRKGYEESGYQAEKKKKDYGYLHIHSSVVKLRNYSPGEMEKLILEKTKREKHYRGQSVGKKEL